MSGWELVSHLSFLLFDRDGSNGINFEALEQAEKILKERGITLALAPGYPLSGH